MTPEPVVEPGTESNPSRGDGALTPAPGATEPHDQPRRWLGSTGLAISLGIAAVVVLLDQLTKHWALSALTDHTEHVIWTLQLNLSFNSGMAFSRGQGIGPIIGAAAIVVVAGLALSARRVGSPLAVIAAGLITGGAIGNLADRLFRGRGWLHGSVIDFIDLQWFPIFNVADAAITSGGVLFFLWSLLGQRQHT
ncbi:MAG: lspA [Ilumatobacteraceae bacterium]|jgi:signal peptidase II|nr:lspA [Ilumatobacteraceae bacterium]